jgi:exonuclease SbcC
MLFKSLKLKNIRSYVEQEIQFPEGTVLLSGDIGAGKSTILFAIEFALFGILRGDLSGSSLLRNGEERGSVELEFELNGQQITVHRKLKRTKDTVEQEAGYIIKNNMRKDGTPQELKTEILEMLGYPKSMLTKSKSMIYRYTVYTPQEEMKRIILDAQESRLDILRKVFDIDKYKRIKENTVIYGKGLRENSREYAGMIADLEDKRKVKKEKDEQARETLEQINMLKPKLDQVKRDLEASKKEISETEESIKKLQELRKSKEIAETQSKLKTEQIDRIFSDVNKLKQELDMIEKEIQETIIAQDISQQLKDKNNLQMQLDQETKEISGRITAYQTKKQISKETRNKIENLNNCPTCLQEVTAIHKTSISQAEDSKIKIFEEHIDQNTSQMREKEQKLVVVKQEIERLREKEKMNALLKLKQANLQDKQKQEKQLLDQQEQLKKEILEIGQNKIKFILAIEQLIKVETEFQGKKNIFDAVSQTERETEIAYSKLIEKKELVTELIAGLEKEIADKQKVKDKLLQLHKFDNWFKEFFLNLVDVVEKQVMTRVYGEFNELFKNWFNVLVEDETIQARLDDRFTPIIQQNGYDIEIENLSGGEKTACALAYRLALNKVINDLITTVQTKQILILDEPTDGFSAEQLDKIRDVLEELNAKQVIIVSHEPKIETFVDSVIHVQKHEHISTANYKY